MVRAREVANGPEPAPESQIFPPGFLWGAATSAYQVEGGLMANNWAAWEQACGLGGQPRIACGQRCGDAVGHWHRFDDDLELMRGLGFTAYRFSVEWSRVEPLAGYADEAALRRYRRWCEQLRAAGIAPLVTLHHFTESLWVSAQGGFSNPETIPAFVRLVERVWAALGDVVEFWITINEPVGYAVQGWWRGEWPPGHTDPVETAQVVRHLLLAHAGAYHTLHRLASGRPCRVGLAHNLGHTLTALRDAIKGGADIRGYVHWSLMDNFEWSYGFSARFGLFRVDYRTGARFPTTSADYYRKVIIAQPLGDSAGTSQR